MFHDACDGLPASLPGLIEIGFYNSTQQMEIAKCK